MQVENPMVLEPITDEQPIDYDVFDEPIHSGNKIWEFPNGDIVFCVNLLRYITNRLEAKETEIWNVNKYGESVSERAWMIEDYVVPDECLEDFLEDQLGGVQKEAGLS